MIKILNNTGAGESVRKRRLVCAFVVRKSPKTGCLEVYIRDVWDIQCFVLAMEYIRGSGVFAS